MRGRLKTLALVGVVTTAALVPLFGDPRATPVTHPLWARMILRALDMTDAIRASARASQVFAALAWRDSLSYPADAYVRADGVAVETEAGHSVVTAERSPAEVTYALAVVQPGQYQLRARLAGSPGVPATAEVTRLRGGRPLRVFTLVPSPEPSWVFGGRAYLDPGAYAAEFLLPPGCALSRVEVAPPCLNPIEPPQGWRPGATTSVQDLAVTALKAIDVEEELPAAATPIELTGEDFEVEAPEEAVADQARASGFQAMSLRAGPRGLRAIVSFELPEAGFYAVSAFTTPGAGQRWVADECRTAMVCPAAATGWRAILNQAFAAGRHTIVVTLGDGAVIEQVRIERKKVAPTDYVETLRRLGFDPGPEGPVARGKAIEAMSFIREERLRRHAEMCGDLVLLDETPPSLPPQVADQGSGPPAPPPPPPPPPVEPPIGPPLLPPQQPASPTQPSGGAF